MRTNLRPVIFLFGPTAVGKTDLLLELFKGKAEVVSADSMQIYRGLDIGTAKPDSSYLAQLPHHLVDICQPEELFSAGDFVERADLAVGDILSRGLIPVISGGTAFYFINFLYGLPNIPPIPSTVRAKLLDELDQKGLDFLYQQLLIVDPLSAGRIPPTNRNRIIRALEVFNHTKRPLSSYKKPTTLRDGLDVLLIGLDRPRKDLYERIDMRVEKMFEDGLEKEVQSLIARGLTADSPAMKGIGYKEFFLMQKDGCLTLGGLKELIKKNSRHYAKRQLTFFRSIADVNWYNPDEKESIEVKIENFMRPRS